MSVTLWLTPQVGIRHVDQILIVKIVWERYRSNNLVFILSHLFHGLIFYWLTSKWKDRLKWKESTNFSLFLSLFLWLVHSIPSLPIVHTWFEIYRASLHLPDIQTSFLHSDKKIQNMKFCCTSAATTKQRVSYQLDPMRSRKGIHYHPLFVNLGFPCICKSFRFLQMRKTRMFRLIFPLWNRC